MNLEECFKKKDLALGSMDLYITKLKKLNDNKPIKNLNFLSNQETILDKIKTLKPNTQRTYIISICSLLKCIDDKKNKKMYDKYSKLLDDFNIKLKDQTEKTETEIDNWIKPDDIIELYNNIKKQTNTNPTKNNYQNLLLLSLYHLIPPRRNKDYQLMKVIKNSDSELSNDFNYIDLDKKQFIFNNYKTSRTYKNQIIDIPDELYNIITEYIKVFDIKDGDDEWLLVNPKTNKPYTNTNTITILLNKIFNSKVSSSMLRKVYLTSKYSDKNKELEKDSKSMGTSVNTATNNYIKK